ncbi:MAG: hypothetical protein ABI570_00875 [Ilumatobacteraceae bacterium]
MDDRRYPRWLWTVFAVPPIVAILVNLFAPEPHGHWTEHLTAVGFKSAQLVLLIVALTLLGWKKLGVALWIAVAVISVGIVNQIMGDYQVAHSIWRTSGDPGFGDGYAQGHSASEFGDLLVLIGGFTFAIIAGMKRKVSVKFAVIAVVMVIIPPPFLWPAAGVLMLVIHDLTSPSRFDRSVPVVA